MLSREENELLVRTGPGTPCGNFMRRYWQPAALSEELPPGGPPIPVRLFGEDLALFRDEHGRPGLLGIRCAHRRADLSYGRIEDGGLRCLYHGWLYDISGRCLETPGEPVGSQFHHTVRHLAYPCQEAGDIIFAYMGPGDPPLLPAYEFLTEGPENRLVTKFYQDCNYLQANEGNVDPQHHSFLHRRAESRVRTSDTSQPFGAAPGETTMAYQTDHVSPEVDVEETDFGMRYYEIRRAPGDRLFVKTNGFVLPNFCTVTGVQDGYTVYWHVPIDDEHHWRYQILLRTAGVDKEATRSYGRKVGPDYHPVRNIANRYLQDREEMRVLTFSGLGDNNMDHDAWATETQEPILDRTQVRAGYNEGGIAMMHQIMLRAIRDVDAGGEAPRVVRDARFNHFPDIGARRAVVPSSVDWREHMRALVLSADREPVGGGAER